jgi:hypothetical protein
MQKFFRLSIILVLSDRITVKGGYSVLSYFYPGSHCAPSLLIGLINMFMMKDRESGFVEYGVDETTRELDNCHLTYWYPLQVKSYFVYFSTNLNLTIN